MSDTKTQKLEKLRCSKTAPVVDTASTRVFTIPDDLHLTPDQRSLLSYGLSFVPNKNPPSASKIDSDMNDFYRRIKLHAHFNDPDKSFLDQNVPDEFHNFQRKPST